MFLLIGGQMMGPLAGVSKFTVSLEKMLADVELRARRVEFAGAVQPFTPVVMEANLCRDATLSHLNQNVLRSLQGHLPQEAGKDRSAATAGIVVSLLNLEGHDSLKWLGYFQKIDRGNFYTIF